MASGFVLKGRAEIAAAALDLDTDANVKVMPLKDTYSHSNTRDFVGDASGMAASECDATGYTGGFGGGGRKVPSSRVWNRDDGNVRLEFDFTDVTWTSLGGATNNTLGGVGLVWEVTSDALSPVVGFDDTNDVTTNGGDIVYAPNAEGMLQF